jgi:hypothetical protein
MKKFDELYESFLKEEEDQDFSYYTGPSESVLFLKDLESQIGRLRSMVENGENFKTVHVATREDAKGYGYPDEPGHEFYIFYAAQDFTKPALIPV